jgi:hypothetical protein
MVHCPALSPLDYVGELASVISLVTLRTCDIVALKSQSPLGTDLEYEKYSVCRSWHPCDSVTHSALKGWPRSLYLLSLLVKGKFRPH